MMKKILFTILLLAVASLGLALPHAATPVATPSNTPLNTTTPVATPSNTSLNTPLSTPASPEATPASSSTTAAAPLTEALAASGVSKECAAALITIATSPEFLQCVPVKALLPIVPILSDPNFIKNFLADPSGTFKKVEPPFVQFSTDFCAVQKCSDKGVQGAIKIMSDGCQAELKSNQLIQLAFAVAVFYSPIHDSICFKDKAGKFCWDETATTVFSLPKSPIKIVDGGLLDAIAVSDPSAMCTRCNKDIVNTFGNFLKDNDPVKLTILAQLGITKDVLNLMQVGVAVKCGIAFEDGKIPDKPGK